MRRVPILIAGAAPVGMTLALVLARLGVHVMLVERNRSATAHPKMDITNVRSMELFRRLGLAQVLRAVAVPEAHPFDVAWVTTMVGHELHRFRYPNVIEQRIEIGRRNDGSQPLEPAMRVSQVLIEPALRRVVEAEPRVACRFGTAFEDCTQDGGGVTAVVREMTTGHTEKIRCAYLAGCAAARAVCELALASSSRAARRSRSATWCTSARRPATFCNAGESLGTISRRSAH